MTIKEMANQLHRVHIKVLKGLNPYDVIEELCWDDLPNQMIFKWMWYFKYRQALLQVKYPRKRVVMERRKYQPETTTEKERLLTRLQNKHRAKKGKITQYTNKIELAIKDWKQLFPIEEHPQYIKAIDKLTRLRREEKELVSEIRDLQAQLS